MSIARRLAALGFGRQLYTFTGGILPPEISFTRASAGWRFNSAGLLVSEATDVARFQYDPATLVSRGLLIEDAAVNAVRNSTMQGAGPGIPGTPPTNWTIGALAGLSSQIVGTGQSSGINYIDIRYFGTTNAGGGYLAVFDTSSGIASANAQTWAQSVYLALMAGAFTNISSVGLNMVIYPGGGSAVHTNVIGSISGTLKRFHTLATINDVSNTNIQPRIAFNCANGAAVDFTLRIGLPQIVQAGVIGSPIPTTSAAVARAADVALLTYPAILGDQCYILKARTPRKISGGAVNVLLHADDGTNNNNRRIVYGTDGRIHVIATSGGVDQCDLDLGAVAADTDFGVAARFAENNFAASLNGGTVVVDSAGVNPTGLTTARLGRRSDGYAWNSTIGSFESRRQASDGDLRALAA